MFAPIAYFAYNRPDHTRRTLEALSKNKLADQSTLYIFIDGPATDASADTIEKIEAVKEIAAEKKWCGTVHIYSHSHNKGLFSSIVDGINSVIYRHGKIIVLEDDVLVSQGFLCYMNDALNLYQQTSEVMHISGFTKPAFKTEKMEASTYFFYHSYCWGWATWQRAWDKFSPQPLLLKKQARKKGNISRLNMDNSFEIFWGLKAIADGKFQSWNTLWHTVIFLNDGLCLHPSKSLVINIGHDGTGTNCKNDNSYNNITLADDVMVKAIALENDRDVLQQHLSMQTFKNKCLFLAKHYLRYITYNANDVVQILKGEYSIDRGQPKYKRIQKPETVLSGIHNISFVIFPHFIPIFF